MDIETAGKRIYNEYKLFIDYLLTQPLVLTRKQKLARKYCFDLNKTLTLYQEVYPRATYDQEDYAIIDFFSLVTINFYVLKIIPLSTKKYKIEKGSNYDAFMSLSPTLLYFMFLAYYIVEYDTNEYFLKAIKYTNKNSPNEYKKYYSKYFKAAILFSFMDKIEIRLPQSHWL